MKSDPSAKILHKTYQILRGLEIILGHCPFKKGCRFYRKIKYFLYAARPCEWLHTNYSVKYTVCGKLILPKKKSKDIC